MSNFQDNYEIEKIGKFLRKDKFEPRAEREKGGRPWMHIYGEPRRGRQ